MIISILSITYHEMINLSSIKIITYYPYLLSNYLLINYEIILIYANSPHSFSSSHSISESMIYHLHYLYALMTYAFDLIPVNAINITCLLKLDHLILLIHKYIILSNFLLFSFFLHFIRSELYFVVIVVF
jgi:hypothetical protein